MKKIKKIKIRLNGKFVSIDCNLNLLKRYITENNKIISSKITSVSEGKQRKLTKEIKKARTLGLL